MIFKTDVGPVFKSIMGFKSMPVHQCCLNYAKTIMTIL